MHESEKWEWSRSVLPNFWRPHGLQPTRLLHPWDFPGKSIGVGCHCLWGSWNCTGDKGQDHPHGKKCKKPKWLSEEALQIAVKGWEVKSKGYKERYTHLNAEFHRIARRDKKAFLSDQCKEIEENIRMGEIRDLFKKIRDTKGTFHAKMSSIKDRNGMNLTEAEGIKKRRQEYTEELYKKRSSRSRESRGCDHSHSPRARHSRMWSQAGLRKHHYKQS